MLGIQRLDWGFANQPRSTNETIQIKNAQQYPDMSLLFARAIHVLDGVFDLCLMILNWYFSAFLDAYSSQVIIISRQLSVLQGAWKLTAREGSY